MKVDRVLEILTISLLAWMFQVHLRLNHVDYNTFHLAGAAVLQGDFSGLYSHERSSMGGFLYPLGAAFFFSVFSAFGELLGRVLFYLLLAGSLIRVLFWCAKNLRSKTESRHVLWLTLLLGSRSINDSWLSGNISLLLLGLSIFSFELYSSGASKKIRNLSSAILGVAVSFKVFPALLCVYWFWIRDLRQIFRIAFWTVLVFLVPYFALALFKGSVSLSWNLLVSWVQSLSNPANYGSNQMIHFQNLSASWGRVSDYFGWNHQWISGALVLTTLLIAGTPCLRSSSILRENQARVFSVILAWIPLLTPVSWHHLGVFYLPLIYLTVAEAHEKTGAWRWVSLAGFFIFSTLTGKSVLGTSLHNMVSNLSVPVFGALGLVLPQTFLVLQRPR